MKLYRSVTHEPQQTGWLGYRTNFFAENLVVVTSRSFSYRDCDLPSHSFNSDRVLHNDCYVGP